MNNIKKRGISLVVLLVTVVMMITLASTVIVQINVSSSNSRLSVFTSNLAQLEENVKAKYILDNKIPSDASTMYGISKNDVLGMTSSSENKSLLEVELASNGETDSSVYYVLDVEELGVDKLDTGMKKQGNDDVYVVSANTLKVYYLQGIKYNDKRYFSINEDVEGVVTGATENADTTTTEDTSVSNISTYEGVQIFKNNAVYTNDLSLKLETNVASGESLRIGFKGISEKTLNVGTGSISLEFSSLEDLNSQNLLNSNFTATEITAFNSLEGDDRKIYVYKYSGENLVGTYEIDVSNFDNGKPTIASNSVEKKDTFSLIKGTVEDSQNSLAVSGVSQVRYEYLTRTDGNTYYNNIVINDEYMKNKAKKIVLDSDGNFGIKIPLDVAVLEVAAIDQAGNYSSEVIQAADINTNKDIIPPVVVATGANEVAVRNKDIKITVTDDGGSGLKADNIYQYQLSKSDTTVPTSWVTYTNNVPFNVGTGLDGTYYLWIKEVKDNAENVSIKEGKKVNGYHVIGKYEFDNVAPVSQTIRVASPASGNYPAGTKVTIEVTFDEPVYGNASLTNVNVSTAPVLKIRFGTGTDVTANFVSSVGKTITYDYEIISGQNGVIDIVSYTGNIYDRLGNKKAVTTVENSGNSVVADTTKPTVNITPNGGNYVVATGTQYSTLKPTVGVTDNIAGVNADSLQYVWSQSTTEPTSGYAKFTNNSEVITTTATAGIWYLYIKATDNIGNANTVKSQPYYVVTDTDMAGRITLTPDKTAWTNTDVKVTAVYGSSLTNSKTLTCSGTVNTDYTVSGTSYVIVKTNSKTVTATAKDGFGNMVTKTLQIKNIDLLKPTVDVSPTTHTTISETKSITITTSDTGGSGLLGTNSYQYQWSNSNTTAPTGTWSNYTNAQAQTHGGTLSGNCYLWVKEIKDVATNVSTTNGTKVSTYHVFGPYTFVPRLTVTFNSNGGNTPSPTSKSVVKGSTYGTLADVDAFGRTFVGWYTAATGGTQVTNTTTVTENANHTLYAHWTPWQHTVKYNANGGTGAPGSQTKTYGSNLTLSTSKPTMNGYTFQSWNTKADGSGTTYQLGGTYGNDQDGGIVELFAIWKDTTPPDLNLSIKATGCQSIKVQATVADGQSGMQKIIWYYAENSTSPSYSSGTTQTVTSNTSVEYNFTGLNDNTTYIIKAVAYDKANNTTTKTITAKTIEAVCQNASGVKYALIQTGFNENNNTTITMIKSTDESATLSSGKTITYNLNGKTVTGNGTATTKAYTIQNNGTLTITGSGSLLSPASDWCDAIVNNAGTLTLNTTGTITSQCYKGNAVYNVSGKIYIKSGTYKATNAGNSSSGTSIVKQAGGTGSLIEISGGSFIQDVDKSICISNYSSGTGELKITGGTFTATGTYSEAIVSGDASNAVGTPVTTITGGTFKSSSLYGTVLLVNRGKTTVSGGTFTNTTSGQTGSAAIVSANSTLIASDPAKFISGSSAGTIYVRTGATFTKNVSDSNITNNYDSTKKVYYGN